MAQTFKKGDKIRFVPGQYSCSPCPDRTVVYTVRDVHPNCDGVYLEELAPHLWYRADHFKLAEPDPRAVLGVPEGYRLVRIGQPLTGEYYLNWGGEVVKAPFDFMSKNNVVLEKTTKTERLWVWVDVETGEAVDIWFVEGEAKCSTATVREVRTNKTREVPA
jgi:hypothetical protein